MAVFSVEGKLGTGKTKFAVYMAQQALLQGRKVASNVDLKPEILCPWRRRHYVRIPDKPTAADFEAMGHGNPDTYDEDRNGVLLLDELGTWLNTRSFQDKGRASVIDWLIHARKHGWDVYLIVQDAGMIDKQVREALIEYQCRCMNLSKIRIPVVGRFLSLISERWGYLPKMHTVTARTGYGQNAIVADKWMYRGNDLHAAYDTRQIFTDSYPHGPHSVLPPWDWQPRQTDGQRIAATLAKIKSAFAKPLEPVPLKPKPRAMLLLQRLPPDERVRLARRYVNSLRHDLAHVPHHWDERAIESARVALARYEDEAVC